MEIILEIDTTSTGSFTEVTIDSLFIVNYDSVVKDFDIQTNEQSFISTSYALRYVLTDDAASVKTVIEEFTITFESACFADSLTWDGVGRMNIDHTFAAFNPEVTALEYTQGVTNCPINIVTEYYDQTSLSWVAYANWEPSFFSLYDASTGAF